MDSDYDNSWLKSSHSYVYVHTPNSNLLCCICRMPFVEPTTSRTCAHSFCRGCIGSAIRASPHCPIDRSPLSPRDMVPSNPIIRHMVDELNVECLNREAGCEFTCQRQLLAAHLKDECLFTEEQCPDPDCSRKVLRKDILGDNSLCPHRPVVCDSCGTELKALELGAHIQACSMDTATCPLCNIEHLRSETVAHAEVCPAAIVACEQASYGCNWTGVRLALREAHLRNCPYVALQGFFRISDAQAAALEAENARLRAQLDSVEGMLSVMRHELQAVKGALGPWYRPDTGLESAPLSPQSQAFSQPLSYSFSTFSSTSAPVYPWRVHHDPPADHIVHMQITPSDDPSISATLDSISNVVHGPQPGISRPDLAAYFPPPSGDISGSPSSSSMNGYTLPAALTALRTALLNHDARSRMTASAHAAELAAMRQVVAGLRMQLHAVLIERSGANADGPGVGVGGWNSPARFFLNPPPPQGISHGPSASITKL